MTDTSARGYIGASLVVRGRLEGEGELEIDGKLEGDLNIAGEISIGKTGELLAPVEAERVVVAGLIRGDVRATESVRIRAGGRLEGDVHALRVSLEDGGALIGAIDMDFELPPELMEQV